MADISYKPVIFHELVIYNLLEIRGTVTLNDMFSAIQYQTQIYKSLGVDIGHDLSEIAAHNFARKITEKTLYGFILGYINPYQVWLFLYCLYATMLFVFLHCCPSIGKVNSINICAVITSLWKVAKRVNEKVLVPKVDKNKRNKSQLLNQVHYQKSINGISLDTNKNQPNLEIKVTRPSDRLINKQNPTEIYMVPDVECCIGTN